MKSNDFSKSSRTDYYRRILGEAVSGDSPAESRMRGDLHVRDLLVLFPNYPPYLRRLLHHVVLSFRDVRKVSGPPKKSFRQECCLNIMIAPKAPMDQRLRLSPE
ncbi:hypothetical protein V6N13_035070 [Hibiscus sabdariffa]